jgi:hypothetical protein
LGGGLPTPPLFLILILFLVLEPRFWMLTLS